nr:hypothetical protein [uncultured Kingella sp.]
MTHRTRFRNPRSRISCVVRNNEAKSETNRLDGFEKMMSLAVKLSIATGFLIVFIYCFFEINWFPIGLSLSDTVGFVMMALGLGVVLFVVHLPILMGLAAILEKDSQNNKFKNNYFLLKIITSISLSLGIIIVIWVNRGFYSAVTLLIVYVIIIFAIFVIYLFLSGKILPRKLNYLYSFIVFIILFVMSMAISVFDKDIMVSLGIRRNNSVIQLSENDYNFVLSEAKRRKLVVSTYSGRKDRSLSGVSILWRGMGSHTLIEFVCKEEKVRMEIKTDESRIIYSKEIYLEEKNKSNAETAFEPKMNKSDENNCVDSDASAPKTDNPVAEVASMPMNASEPALSSIIQPRRHFRKPKKQRRCYTK